MELQLNHYIKRSLEFDGIFCTNLGAVRLDGVWFQHPSSLHSFRHQARRMSILRVISFFSTYLFERHVKTIFYLKKTCQISINPLNPELNPICYLLALLGAHHFLHVSRIRVKSLTFRRLMSYICGAPILDVSRSHTTTQHSR